MAFKQPTPEDWLQSINEGLEYRRKFGVEDLWGTLEAIYYNVAETMLNDGPNIFLSQGDAMLSTLTVPSPVVKVTATKPEEVDKAPLVQTLDNTLVREMNLPQEVDTAALHAFLFGRGILKIGYDSEWGYDPTLDMGGTLQMGLTLTQLNKKGDRRIEYDSSVSPGAPWVRAVMPHDIVVPWGTKELESTPWVAHRVVRHIDDLRADPKYENTRALQPQISMQSFIDSYRTIQRRTEKKLSHVAQPDYVEMWEIHDRRTGKIQVVTSDWSKFLRNDDNALQVANRLPFTAVGFTPRTRAFWTTPDAYYLYYIQNELSDVAVQRTKQRRISTIKFLYDKGAISDTELEKILSPDVGVAAAVENGHDINKVITKLDNSPNLGLAQEEDLLRANAREQIGFSRNQLGEYTSGRKTATEAAAVQGASRLRMSRRGLQIKRLYEDTIRTVNNVVFQHWTLPRYIAVMGQANTAKWLQVNGPSLRGRYDYDISFVEQAELEQMKIEALQLYGVLSQDPSVDPVELRNYLVNRVNDPAFERIFNADIRVAMQQLQASGGALQPQGNRGGDNGTRGLLPMLQGQGRSRSEQGQRSVMAL